MKKIFWLIVLIMIYSCGSLKKPVHLNLIKGDNETITIDARKNDSINAVICVSTEKNYAGFNYDPGYKNFLSAHMINNYSNFLKFGTKDHWGFSFMGLCEHNGYIYYGDNTIDYMPYNDLILDSFALSTKRDLRVGGGMFCNSIFLNGMDRQQIKFAGTDIEINNNQNFLIIKNDSTTFNNKIVGTDITATGTIDASSQPIKIKTYKQDSEPDIPNNTTAIWVNTKKQPLVIYLLVDIDGIQVKGKLSE